MNLLIDEEPEKVFGQKWSVVIACPNPDYGRRNTERAILRDTAIEIFDNCFNGEEEEFFFQREQNKRYERIAFTHCFDRLESLTPSPSETNRLGVSQLKETVRRWSNSGGVEFQGDQWRSSELSAGDFLSLVRNVIMTSLTIHMGLTAKTVFSAQGRYIYILIDAEDDILENEAELTRYNLQLEMGATDLESLEPCDNNLRCYKILKKDGECEMLLKKYREM
jgi:hypothetical protein